MKKLYLISQDVNNGYDTYDSAVVCAESEKKAKLINPGGFYIAKGDDWYFKYDDGSMEKDNDTSWCNIKDVKVKEIGIADDSIELGIVCARFNAG